MLHFRLYNAVLLCLGLLLTQPIDAIEPEQLNVKLHRNMLKESRNIMFGSVVEISNLHAWNDENIIHLAYAAHEARRQDFNKNKALIQKAKARGAASNVERWLPPVTTTLIVGDMAYIATSLKGGAFLYQRRNLEEPHWTELSDKCDKIVSEALAKCQTKAPPVVRKVKDEKDKVVRAGHRTGASCGEPLAVQNFCRSHPPGERNIGDLAGAKIIAIQDRFDDQGVLKQTTIAPPCGPKASEWGCAGFVKELQLRVIVGTSKGTAKEVVFDEINTWEFKI